MNRLTLYVARTVLGASFAVLILLGGIWGLFELLNQLGDVGTGQYQVADALQFTGLSLLSNLYKLLPPAALLGALIGLGLLASHSELTVMRAAGVSTGQIAAMVLKTALLLALLGGIVGEGYAPAAKRAAQELRWRAINGEQGVAGSYHGVWARDGRDFVHLHHLSPNGQLLTLTRYRFDDSGRLTALTRAEKGQYLGGGQWRLQQLKTSLFRDEVVVSASLDEELWSTTLTPDKLGVIIVAPDELSIEGLQDYRNYLRDNGLASEPYDLAFWRKLLQPLATALMMFVGMSFIFGPLRSGSLGAKILVGIAAGFGFHLISAMFGPMSLVYGMPPLLAALLPLLAFGGLGLWLLRRAS